jgi:hypothetical protein
MDFLKDVISKFLGNYRDQNYKNIISHMLDKFKELGCNMSLKVHFSNSHLEYFTANLGAISENEGKGYIKISRRWKEGIREGGT